jgi:hypothetical protein
MIILYIFSLSKGGSSTEPVAEADATKPEISLFDPAINKNYTT